MNRSKEMSYYKINPKPMLQNGKNAKSHNKSQLLLKIQQIFKWKKQIIYTWQNKKLLESKKSMKSNKQWLSNLKKNGVLIMKVVLLSMIYWLQN